MIANIKGNTFLVFMGFDILATVFCWFFVKETRGKNLEIAAGTEWEVAERSASRIISESEKGGGYASDQLPESKILHGDKDGALINEVTGKEVDVVAVHDTFGSNLLHRK